MKLYNSLTQRVEPLKTKDDKVGIYVCGITPYDTTHIGHAFTYTTFDTLIRYLEMRGLDVNYVQNITDIDDDMVRKSKEIGEDWRGLGDRWLSFYIRDMQNLNVRPPDHFPRASEAVQDMVNSIQSLLDAGIAYRAGGNIYYAIDKWTEFGKLCRLPRSEMLPVANERGNHPDDPYKRDPLDFVLWQAEAVGEPSWASPWGKGRPGWHIECSTLATKYLGKVVDIHGGGADLCFPHHEAEIAQVEPVSKEQPFVRLWMHTAMVEYQGKKMSKSLGNLVMIRDLLKTYSPDAVRLYLAKNHYRKPWSFKEEDLQKAEKLARKLLSAATVMEGDGAPLRPDSIWAAFISDMENDLDTPGAVDVLGNFADDILEAAEGGRSVKEAQDALRQFTGVFGLRLENKDADQKVVDGWNAYLPAGEGQVQ